MMGSVSAAGWLAHGVFWALLIVGWQDLWPRKTALFVAIWLAGYAGLPFVHGELFFMPLVAILDIALVFLVFYGDA